MAEDSRLEADEFEEAPPAPPPEEVFDEAAEDVAMATVQIVDVGDRAEGEVGRIRSLVVGDRQFVDEALVTGEVMKVAKSYAWVRPCGYLPSVFHYDVRIDQEGEPMVYVALADVAQDGLVLTVGMLVLFRPYICPKGVGGCEVEST